MGPQLSPLAAVVPSARTLRERIRAVAAGAAASGPADPRSDAAVDRWREALDRAGPGRFERRLRWDGLDEAALRAGLLASPAGEEPWADLLGEASAAARGPFDADDPALDAAEPIAFEEVLLPFVTAARARLEAADPALDAVLAPAARAALDRALLAELSGVAEQALLLDLSVARARSGSGGALFGLGATSRAAYRRMVESLRAAGLEPLVSRYPVLARLLAVRAGFWVRASAEFAAHCREDAAALAERFGGGAPGAVVWLRTGRGETHGGGRTVSAVRFASGLEVMYKPRSLQVDVAFYGLLAWIAERGLAPAQRILRVVERGGHGWVEYVRHAPLASEAEARAYYERAGALLCVTYLLGAGDLHAENLIAAGAYPVPVDLETIVGTAVMGRGERIDGATAGRSAASYNVLSTGLLPYWQLPGAGAAVPRAGGLGVPRVETVLERGWRFVNTDRMAREEHRRPAPEGINAPRLDGRAVPPEERVEDLLRGFERCHAFLAAHRAELAAPDGPLDAFRGQRVRVVLRDTRTYDAALRASLHPRRLADGVERGIQLELLRSAALSSDEPLPYWPAFESEQHDLDDLDFPLFWAFTDGTILHDARDRPVGAFCAVSAFDAMRRRLARMGDDERRRQASLARLVYRMADGPAPVRGPDEAPELDPVAEARAVAAALESLVVPDEHGSPQWVGRDGSDAEAPNSPHPLSDRLYDGRPGVALFLAAVDAVAATGHAELAGRTLAPLRRTLRDAAGPDALAARLGVGGALGMGGIVYALTRIGGLTGDPSWIDDAARAARAITPAAVAEDPVLEVLGGSAGAALALLALHEATGDRRHLEAARGCGDRLLRAALPDPASGLRAWRLEGGRFATGFAHGAGGIAAALHRLAAACGSGAFADAADEAFRFEDAAAGAAGERAHVHAAGGAWSHTWCNGPLGIALARTGEGGGAAGVPAAAPLESLPDHPCCGHMGRVELLLARGDRDEAHALAAQVVARARRLGSYSIDGEVPDSRFAPAFFQGLAGIGYTLLRVGAPERLPSVLAFR